jgi:hypothetical protein
VRYRAMAFAQPTYRNSLGDQEPWLSVQRSKLYHTGFSDPIGRSTLADANESRDWRNYPAPLRRIRFRDAETGKVLVFLTNDFEPRALTIAALHKNRRQVELLFQMDQAAPADQAVLRQLGEHGKEADLDRRVGSVDDCDHQEAAPSGSVALHH